MNMDSSFIRWQEIRIKQFGYVNYLLILVASGILTLQNNVWSNKELTHIQKICLNELNFFLFISIVFGILLTYNRLRSFRYTAKIAWYRENSITFFKEGKITSIYQLRDKTNTIDSRTWVLLYYQLTTFLIGILALFIINFFQ